MPVKIHYLLGRVPDSSSWAHTFMMQSYTHQHSLYVSVCVCVCVCEGGGGGGGRQAVKAILESFQPFYNLESFFTIHP